MKTLPAAVAFRPMPYPDASARPFVRHLDEAKRRRAPDLVWCETEGRLIDVEQHAPAPSPVATPNGIER